MEGLAHCLKANGSKANGRKSRTSSTLTVSSKRGPPTPTTKPGMGEHKALREQTERHQREVSSWP